MQYTYHDIHLHTTPLVLEQPSVDNSYDEQRPDDKELAETDQQQKGIWSRKQLLFAMVAVSEFLSDKWLKFDCEFEVNCKYRLYSTTGVLKGKTSKIHMERTEHPFDNGT